MIAHKPHLFDVSHHLGSTASVYSCSRSLQFLRVKTQTMTEEPARNTIPARVNSTDAATISQKQWC